MTDLDERFRSLGRTPPPDLWDEIHRREPRVLPEDRPRRSLVAAVAFAVAAAGVALAALTFGGAEPGGVTGTSGAGGAVANGSIYFRVGGAEGGSRIESIEPDGTDRHVMFPEDSPVHFNRIAFSPDGTRIAFTNFLVGEYGIETADPDGSDIVRLTDGVNDSWASWSPNGSKILYSSTRYDPSIPACTPGDPHEFGCPTDIYVMDANGSNVVRLTDDPAGEFMPRWSPTGDRIAFVREGDPVAGTFEAVYVMDADGSNSRQVSSASGGSDFWPSWSPDGSKLVFAAIRFEDWGIWIVDADGSNEHRVYGGVGTDYVDDPIWSPDGKLIAFVGNPTVDDYSPDDALYVMRPDGTGITPLADAPGVGVAGDIAWQPVLATAVEPVPSQTRTSLTAELVDTFDIAVDVRSVAYGEGSVWVAASDDDGALGGRIIRIDPATHEVQAEIAVGAIPTWEVGGGAMTFADGDLWVAGDVEKVGDFDDPGGGADAAVVRIDPSTNEVVRVFEIGGTSAADLTFLNGDLWVLVFGDETVDHRMEVVRIDPMTGAVLTRIPLSSGWAHTLVLADGRLVVYEGGDRAVNVDGHLTSIDPVGGVTTTADVPPRYFEGGPVLWRGELWFASDRGFSRFDPASNTVMGGRQALDPSRYALCCGFVEADDRGIWFLAHDGIQGEGPVRVTLFDPAIDAVTELVTLGDENPVAMAIASDSVWILNYEGTLTKVDLTQG